MQTEFNLSNHPEFAMIWEKAAPFAMMTPERAFALYQAVNAVIHNSVPGNFVDCGVRQGGSAMIMALTLKNRNALREIFLFDTYEEMTEPSQDGVDLNGRAAMVKASASLEVVKEALSTIDYPQELFYFVKGDVHETLRKTRTSRISLLRLDADFYDNTTVSLQELWRRLTSRGIFIIEDYGHCRGAKEAFHNFFDDDTNGFDEPLLWPIDCTGYGGVKLQEREDIGIERYDFIPAGFDAPDLLPLFPYAEEQNPEKVNWQYLRAQTPHIWRSDIRDDKPWPTGNVSVEEGACLYTLAKQFKGMRALEIGSHFGWTAAHILSAGLNLDCIDPEFSVPERSAAVSKVLELVETQGTYNLWGGFSPDLIDEVRASRKKPFSFVLVDGSHDGDAPRQDALGLLPHLARDCLVVFHDLTSPFVERGLYAMRRAGFETCIYNTMQILGLAWRGRVRIPVHKADPNVSIFLPNHLHKYLV